MKEETVWRLNGWGSIFRFITPLLVGILLAQFNWSQTDQREFRKEVKADIAQIQVSLDNHIKTDFAELKDRLIVIETLLQVKRK